MEFVTRSDPEATPGITGPADLPLVIAEWERLNQQEPWHVDPHRYGVDSLHDTIRAVLEIATSVGTDPGAAERLVRSAAAHGEQRRAQRASDDALLQEYHALRAAIWRVLHHANPDARAIIGVIVRVDVAIGVATTIALRGFHRSELPAGTAWEADLLRQVAAVSRHLSDRLQAGAPA